MSIIIETKRLIIREIDLNDKQGMFELDSDPDVHKYLDEPIVYTIEESINKIKNVQQQYINNGVGRWAIIEKSTNEFLGWAGLKLEEPKFFHPTKYYDIGYRLIKKYWGKGYATEASRASLLYGIENLNIKEIYADVDSNNFASKKVLEKIGLKYLKTFDDNGFNVDWYKM
jgi:ribosomal-protein-alanine N-acetyltransferase